MDADEKFRQEVGHLFAKLPLVPEDEIADVHSWGFAEDGRTFVRMLDTLGGKTPDDSGRFRRAAQRWGSLGMS
jgi:hypothetical protein